ncbi:MAG: hypothetical protein WA215_00025 [Candidatus Cybelea sp.]
MPTYGLVEGLPCYSAGTAPVGGNALMFVLDIAVASDVVTLTVLMQQGNIPAVGDLVSVQGIPVAPANVTNAAITGVSITASTGQGTITYAATTPDLAKVSMGGQAISIPQPIPEALTGDGDGQAFQAFAVPRNVPALIEGRPISLNVQYPTAPGTIACSLQGAINNVDGEFADLPNYADVSDQPFAIVAGGTYFYSFPNIYNFVRFKDASTNGEASDTTVIAKILI